MNGQGTTDYQHSILDFGGCPAFAEATAGGQAAVS
jgi:hypothetical protein